jgi:hypothetical protein
MEPTQMLINSTEKKKQTVTLPYNGIVFSHKKKWSVNTLCYYAKLKKSDTKGHNYMSSLTWTIRNKFMKTDSKWMVVRTRHRKNGKWLLTAQVSFWDNQFIMELDGGNDFTTLWIYYKQ